MGARHDILDEIDLINLSSSIGSSASAAAFTGDHSSAANTSVLRRASRGTDVHALQLSGTDDSEHEPESFGVRRLPSNVVRWVSHNSWTVSKDQLTNCNYSFSLWFCCCLPCCLCRKYEHSCPSCKKILGFGT